MSYVLPPDPDVGAAVCAALRAQVEKLGLSIGDEPHWLAASFEEVVDPFSREVSKVAFWRGANVSARPPSFRTAGSSPNIRCCSRIRLSPDITSIMFRSGVVRSA